jgi:hypothetical protein
MRGTKRFGWAALAVAISLAQLPLGIGAARAETPVPDARGEAPSAPRAPAAEPQSDASGKAWSKDSCKKLYDVGALQVQNDFLSFKPVFGKKSINWTDEDYKSLIALARACNGFSPGDGNPLDYRPWATMVNNIRNRILPIAGKAEIIIGRIDKVKVEGIRKPNCEEMIGFKLNAYEGRDSSQDLFGVDFMAMSLSDLEKTVSITNLCLGYLPDYAHALGGWRKEGVREEIYRVMDRALIIQKRRLEWEALPRYDTDLVLDREGILVPTTFTSPDAREMISRFNKSTALRKPFSPETIGVLLRMAAMPAGNFP